MSKKYHFFDVFDEKSSKKQHTGSVSYKIGTFSFFFTRHCSWDFKESVKKNIFKKCFFFHFWKKTILFEEIPLLLFSFMVIKSGKTSLFSHDNLVKAQTKSVTDRLLHCYGGVRVWWFRTLNWPDSGSLNVDVTPDFWGGLLFFFHITFK